MDSYIKELESQNEELQKKLAANQLNNDLTDEFKVFMAHYIKALESDGSNYMIVFKYVSEMKKWDPKTIATGKQVLHLVPYARF
jgi:hypothetical protein